MKIKKYYICILIVLVILVAIISSTLTYMFITRNSVVNATKKASKSVVMVNLDFYLQDMTGKIEENESNGSGVIYSEDGYIVTNYHVIEEAINANNTSIIVTLYDGTQYEAEIVGTDYITDLALLKIDASNLKAAKFGKSSKLQVGDTAIAIGTPINKLYSGTVTVGHISALNRTIITEGRVYEVLQTDAAINSGNSGGALVNIKGEVIGINSLSNTENEGIAFSIPSDRATEVIEQLLNNGKVRRTCIGIYGLNLDSITAKRNALVEGVYVYKVYSNSAASRANICQGDIIVSFDGINVKTKQQLNDLRNQKSIGETAIIRVFRAGEYKDLKIILLQDDNEYSDVVTN